MTRKTLLATFTAAFMLLAAAQAAAEESTTGMLIGDLWQLANGDDDEKTIAFLYVAGAVDATRNSGPFKGCQSAGPVYVIEKLRENPMPSKPGSKLSAGLWVRNVVSLSCTLTPQLVQP